MKKGPLSAKKAPVADSMMKSHCQPDRPMAPCKLPNTPAAIKPEDPIAMQSATYMHVTRRAISPRVYQAERQKTAPGKNGASANPRKNLTTNRVSRFVTPAVAADKQDQTKAQPERYRPGRIRVSSMFEGICPIMYPAVRTEMAELKSVPVKFRSSSKVLRRA